MKSIEYYRLIVDRVNAGKLPVKVDGLCWYYFDEDRRCAIGLLLTKEQASRVESRPAEIALRGLGIEPESFVEGATYDFFADLQVAHDANPPPAKFLTEVNNVFDAYHMQRDQSEGCDRLRQDAVPPMA